MHGGRIALIAFALLALACNRQSLAPPIHPDMVACLTPQTVWIAGVDLEKLRAAPLYASLAPSASLLLENLRQASYVILASDGRNLLLIEHGQFATAPAGATLIDSHLALSGPPEGVQSAIRQHHSKSTGAADLVARAAPVATAPIWGAVRGGVTLPLTGNFANVNRLLHLVDYATLTVKLDSSVALELTGLCRDASTAQHLEETVRAILTLVGAASPQWDKALSNNQIVRENAGVRFDLSVTPETLASLLPQTPR